MSVNIDSIKAQIKTLRDDITDLEAQLPRWNPDNLAGAKQPRLIARRIVQSSQRLETLVKENTFSPST
jgi:hypothetical protein